MIRVLHVITRMAPGGTEVQLLGMLKAAHNKHWHATLCLLSNGWPLADEVAAAGIPVVALDGVTKFDPRRPIGFRRLVRHADVIHSSLPGANAFSRISAVGQKRPALVVSERGVDDHRSYPRRVTDRLLRKWTDAYIGNSDDVTGFIRSTHSIAERDPRVFEIGNGIDTDVFMPVPQRPMNRPGQIITAGRLVPNKRIDLAISIFRQLSKSADVAMMIVGDGPERPHLEHLAAGLPITFVGHVADRTSLAKCLQAADVFLMTSAAEGLPNAVLEALACGLPVVAADVPGIRAARGPGVSLIGGNHDDWCRAILDALRWGKQRVSLVGDRAASFETVAIRHLEVFNWAIERSQASRDRRRNQRGHHTSSEVLWPIQSTLADD